jgi:biofilm protein TabA
MIPYYETGKSQYHSRKSATASRRQFLRTVSAIGASGSLCLLSNPLGEVLASSASTREESRLIQGYLKSWRLNPRLARLEVAFHFLERSDPMDLVPGEHWIDDKAYAIVAKSTSQAPELVQFEAHREYIDVHYMVSGQSIIGFVPIEKLKIVTPYQPAEDAATYGVPETYERVKMYPGKFAVFFPGGGHMPNCNLDGPHEIHTVVVKVQHDLGLK